MQVDVFSSTDIGHYVALKEKNLLEKYVPDNASKVIDVYKNYDPDGYLHRHLGRPDRDRLQHRQAEGSRRAEELDRPARSEVEGQGLARPSRLLRLCRHLGGDAEEALRLGVLREAREEQAADRPLDQRHRDHAQRRRAHRRRLRPRRHRAGQRRQGQSARDDLSERRLGADHRAVRHPEGRASTRTPPSCSWSTCSAVEASKIWVEHFNESMRPEVQAARRRQVRRRT